MNISFLWKVTKDLDSIDPDEREALWDRLEGYGVEYVDDVEALAEQIRELQMREEFAVLRNLGDWENVARYWISDRYSVEQARWEVRSSEYAAEQLRRARHRYNLIKNLGLTVRTKNPIRLEEWRRARAAAYVRMQYWQAVLDHRHESYQRLLRRITKSRRRVSMVA